MFDVDIKYANANADRRDISQMAASATIEAHNRHKGDILVFLPGQGEIERCQQLLGSALLPTSVIPLYGNLPPQQQYKAIAPSRDGERKVVLATPIAETSLTIEGVRVVVDSGLCRQMIFDARTGLSHLETVRISMDMATQRSGRAGRVAEGICYRLWTKASEHLMGEQRKPEIEEADLAPMLLEIAAFGENDVKALPWLTMPPQSNVVKAHSLLISLGAIDEKGCITTLGKRMAALPCHPRIARMILQASDQLLKGVACDIAAILEEKDPMGESARTDLGLRITTLRQARRNKQTDKWLRIAQIAAEYRRMVHVAEDNNDVAPTDIGMLVAYAYPERIAMSIDNIGGYRLASGANVKLEQNDSQAAHKWLAIASLNNASTAAGRIFMAAPLNPDDLDDSIITERDNISWDSKQGCVLMQTERRIGKLTISSKPIHNAVAEDVVNIICEAVKKDGMSMLDWSNAEVTRLQNRVAQVKHGIPN